ncbi:hypothetical protein SAMN05216264_102119 [Pseudomonas marincola]|nr:hypothetical protein SAMN05216264_102119 [Pseudomonas marincola]
MLFNGFTLFPSFLGVHLLVTCFCVVAYAATFVPPRRLSCLVFSKQKMTGDNNETVN